MSKKEKKMETIEKALMVKMKKKSTY